MLLREIIEFKNGKKKPSTKGQIPIYGGNGILDYTDQSNYDDENLIVGRVGAYCGCVYSHYGRCWVSDNAIVGKVLDGNDFYYCYYLLKRLNLNARHVGSGQPLMTQEILNSIEVDLPDYDTQKKIGKILKNIDDKIELNNKINNNLHDLAEQQFNEIYSKGTPEKMEKLWFNVSTGSRPKGGAQKSGIPSIGAEKIERFGIYNYSSEKYISEEYYEKLKNGKLNSGDVLLYKDGAYTGKVSMCLNGFPHNKAAVNEHVFILNTENNWAQNYLYFTLCNKDNREMLHRLASSKAAQPGLNQVEIKSIEINIAEKEYIINFENIVKPIMEKIVLNSLENKKLADLRDTLLPKLMNGKIDLDNIDI